MSKYIKYSLLLLVALIALAIYSVTQIKQNAQAYLYGYPLVLMDQTREIMTSDEIPINHFRHTRTVPDHNFRNVVRPNNDTLYSVAWLDLSKEPIVLSVPDTRDRYYVMPFMDAWTNVFAMVGKRSTGTILGDYAVTGPDWQGKLPDGIIQLSAPTNMVWLIGRIQLNGTDDISAVAELQKEFLLTPMSKWESGVANPPVIDASDVGDDSHNPGKLVESMPANKFFNKLANLMGNQAAAASDAELVQSLAKINIIPGQNFDISSLNFLERFLLNKSVPITLKKIKQTIEARKNTENGWVVYRDIIGNYENNYGFRAGVAMIGLGALPPEEAAYPNTNLDSNGEILSGAYKYKIHFKAGQLPPVHAFWSLAMYDENGFFINNPIKRYSIGDRDNLHFNQDGSLDLYIQTTEPAGHASNWLPSPSGKFNLAMRLYHRKSLFWMGAGFYRQLHVCNNFLRKNTA